MRTPDEIRRTAENKYREFLREHLAGRSIFPYEIAFGRPRGGRDLDRVAEESRSLVEGSALRLGYGYTVETSPVGTRYGEQRLPVRVYFPDATNFLRFIGKEEEFVRIQADIALISMSVPAALGWASLNPIEVLAHSGQWQEICIILAYLLSHPQPGCYPRELPLNVSGKLLGDEQAVICDVLRSIPGPHWKNGPDYLSQLGLRRPPGSFIRLRFLDIESRQANHFPVDELSLSSDVLANTPIKASRIFVTENLMTYLSFPFVDKAVAIFGEGNAAARLAQLTWLKSAEKVYWGDLDPYGFSILNRLRAQFPHVRSMLMGEATFRKFDHLGMEGKRPDVNSFELLNDEERRVANLLYLKRWSIEQEKIPQSEVTAFLAENSI